MLGTGADTGGDSGDLCHIWAGVPDRVPADVHPADYTGNRGGNGRGSGCCWLCLAGLYLLPLLHAP